MRIEFNKLKKARNIAIELCKTNGEALYSLAGAVDKDVEIMLNGLSELSFKVYKNEQSDLYYDEIIGRKYVKVENIGLFIIKNVTTENDGVAEYKQVDCVSAEFELASKNMGLLEGTYKFYDPSSSDKSLMNIVLSYLPNWKIGQIEDDLWNIYRTFDIKDNNIYNFLMSEVQEAYQCVFIFDTTNRTISAKTTKSIVRPTDIFLSNRNLVKRLSVHEDSEEVKTALNIYGDGDLSIHSANPLGTATLYDFSYYKSLPNMMSKELITAIDKWEAKKAGYEEEYKAILKALKGDNGNTVKLESELKDLEGELNVLEDQQAIQVAAGEDLTEIARKIEAKKAEIEAKKREITASGSSVEENKKRLKEIAEDLKFPNNFSQELIKELSVFIIQATHQCTNFGVTDEMNENEKLEVIEQLKAYGEEQLKRVSQPTYTFDIDVINFTKLIKYKKFIEQLELGSEVTICVDRETDKFARVLLVGYSMNLDSSKDMQLHFSNKLKFGSDQYTWEELINQSASVSTTVDFESPSWGKAESANSKIDEYINAALDLTQKEIISSDNQEFTLTRQGLRGREWNEETQSYLPEQLWMTKNVLAFSDNGFTGRPRMALGKTLLPDGTYGYGIIAEQLVGNIMLTKKLVVENENHSFKVDGDSILIKNANIIMNNDGTSNEDKTLEDLLEQAMTSGGNVIYRQPEPPTSAKENDLWFDTDDNNKPYVFKNGEWVSVRDTSSDGLYDKVSGDISNAIGQVYEDMESMKQAIEDGEMVIYYQETQPSIPPAKEGDLWYDTTLVNGAKKNEAWIVNKGIWNKIKDNDVINALDKAGQAQITADGKIKTYWQANQPTGLEEKDLGDLWFDIDDNNKLYRWNGREWIDVQDKSYKQMSQDFASSIEEINNKIGDISASIEDGVIETYYQPTDPMLDSDKTPKVGDLWFDTKNGKLYRHNGGKSSYINYLDDVIRQYIKFNDENVNNVDDPISPNNDASIVSVETFIDIKIEIGGSYTLREETIVKLSDGRFTSLGVKWDDSHVDTRREGTYTVYGDVILRNNITNPNNIRTEVKIIVGSGSPPAQEPITITSIENPSDLTIEKGGIYSLPSKVLVNLSNSRNRYLNVVWHEETINVNVPNVYVVYGDIQLEDGIKNPLDLRAQRKITVLGDTSGVTTITSIESLSSTTIDKGGNYSLPSQVLVSLSTGGQRYMGVRWQDSHVDVWTPNTYIVYGDITLDGDITNPLGLRAEKQIIVQGATSESLNITSVINPEPVIVQKYGQLSLPRQVQVRLSNSSTRYMNVSWDSRNVDTSVVKTYDVYGSIQLENNITNTSNIKAHIQVIVQAEEVQTVNITRVNSLDDVVIAVGGSYKLPNTVSVQLSNQTTRQLKVSWDTGSIDIYTPKTYPIEGDIVLEGNITNTQGLKARVNVVVKSSSFTFWDAITDKGIIEAIDQARNAQTTADGKISSYYTPTKPTTSTHPNLSEGDIWIDTDDGNRQYRYTSGQWKDIHDKSIDKVSADLANSITGVYDSMEELKQAIGDGEIVVYYQPNTPSSPKDGDLWYDTDDKNKAYIYKNGRWNSIQDGNIIDALDKAGQAQATADGKIKTYWQPTQPSPMKPTDVGDLWIDTDDKNKLYRYNGSTWVSVRDATIDDVAGKVDNVVDRVDSVIDSNGNLDASKMKGEILAGKTNILCANAATGRVLALNENGIIVGTANSSGTISQEGTFITKNGIVADAIKSGTINAINIKGSNITGSNIKGSEIIAGSQNNFHTILNDRVPFGTYYGASNTPAIEVYANSSTNTGWSYLKMYDESGDPVFRILGARRAIDHETTLSYMTATTLTISAHNGYYKKELVSSGKKQAIVPTEHYGYRELYCEESTKVYFTDSGISETKEYTKNGEIYYAISIAINPVFLETIEPNSMCRYIISATPYSDARVWVAGVYDKYINIRSDKPTEFSYEIKGVRKGYKDNYINERSNVFREIASKEE